MEQYVPTIEQVDNLNTSGITINIIMCAMVVCGYVVQGLYNHVTSNILFHYYQDPNWYNIPFLLED
jgi:hypothetical protein